MTIWESVKISSRVWSIVLTVDELWCATSRSLTARTCPITIIYNCEKYHVPYVLAGSIRDDGPLPPVFGNVYEAQNAMRDQIRSATTVICMATMLHTIATGNMTPSYRVMADGTVRQIYFYCVDISEFAVNKLADRGSLSARGIVTNVQDFICTTAKALGL